MHRTLHHNHDLNLRMNFPVLLLSLVLTRTGNGNFPCDPDSHCKGGRCEETGCVNGCEDGFYGRYCKTECSDGCKDKKCVDQGYCEGDCVDGKRGRQCKVDCWHRCCTCPKNDGSLCTTCQEFNYGPLCLKSCRKKCPKTGCGMQGKCKKTCSNQTSTDCVQACGIGCKTCNENICEACHKAFRGQGCGVYCGDCKGECTDLGCVDGCKPGYFGTECEYRCNAHCKGELCDHRTGYCSNGCSLGYYGPNCRIPCKNCKDDRCDHDSQSGECTLGCKMGFYGIQCSQQCHPDCLGFCTRFKGACFTPPVTDNSRDENNLKLILIIVGSCVGFLIVGTIACLLVFRWCKCACFREPRAMPTTNCKEITLRTLPSVPRQTVSTDCDYSYIDEDINPSDDSVMVTRGGHEARNLLRSSVLVEPHLSWFENTKVCRSSFSPVERLDMRLSGFSGDYRSSASHRESMHSMIECWSLSRQHSSGRNKVCVYDVSGKYLLAVDDTAV